MKKKTKKAEPYSGYVLVSVPPESAPCIGGYLCKGKPGIPTREAANRVYFLVPDCDEVDNLFWHPEAEINYFENEDEAEDWASEDELRWTQGEPVRQSNVVH